MSPAVPLIATVCGDGFDPPGMELNVSGVVGTVSVFWLTTTIDTGIVAGLPVAPAAVTVTVPLYVPAAKPVVFTDTVMLPGTVPLVAASHDPPLVVAGVAV